MNHRKAMHGPVTTSKGRDVILVSLRLILLVAVAAVGVATVRPARAVYQVGDTVADFTMPGLDGQDHNLYELQGRVVLLNFFATWCLGCNEEAEYLEHDIWNVYRDRGVTVLAVDLLEPVPLVEGWAQAVGVTYPIWLAPDYTLLLEFLEFGGLPYNTVIDPAAVLRYSQTGFDLLALIQVIDEILAEATPAEDMSWSLLKRLYR